MRGPLERGLLDACYATFEGSWPSPLPGGNLAASARKVMLMAQHINATALESHSFCLQEKSLLETILARQGDMASRTQHSLPRQTGYLVQDLRHMPGTAWIAGGLGNRTVGTD